MRRALALGSLVAGIGCGDPLVDGSYPGESLFSVISTVKVHLVDEAQQVQGDLRVAMFWMVGPSGHDDPDSHLDIPEQAVLISRLPGYYGFNLYEAPPESVMIDDGDGRYAIGTLLLYLDAGRDGVWDRKDDWLIGAVPESAYLFTRDGASLDGLGEFAPGYHVLHVDRADPKTKCEDGVVALSRSDEGQELVVDFLDQVLVDPNCDDDASEWDLCPVPGYLREDCEADWDIPECWPWRHCGP